MGARGPLPMPDNVRALRGLGPSPTARPKAPPGIPPAPTYLRREASAEWQRVVRGLDAMGILATIDRAVLTAYVETWAVWKEARDDLAKRGHLVEGDRGKVKNPSWQIYREATTVLANLARELGLTPGARLRMELPTPAATGATDADDFDPFD